MFLGRIGGGNCRTTTTTTTTTATTTTTTTTATTPATTTTTTTTTATATTTTTTTTTTALVLVLLLLPLYPNQSQQHPLTTAWSRLKHRSLSPRGKRRCQFPATAGYQCPSTLFHFPRSTNLSPKPGVPNQAVKAKMENKNVQKIKTKPKSDAEAVGQYEESLWLTNSNKKAERNVLTRNNYRIL